MRSGARRTCGVFCNAASHRQFQSEQHFTPVLPLAAQFQFEAIYKSITFFEWSTLRLQHWQALQVWAVASLSLKSTSSKPFYVALSKSSDRKLMCAQNGMRFCVAIFALLIWIVLRGRSSFGWQRQQITPFRCRDTEKSRKILRYEFFVVFIVKFRGS